MTDRAIYDRRYKERHPERVRAAKRAWYASLGPDHPYRVRGRERAARAYNADPERYLARARKWDQLHPHRRREVAREAKRRARGRRVCATIMCGQLVPIGCRGRYCDACALFYRTRPLDTILKRRRRVEQQAYRATKRASTLLQVA